MADSDSAIIRRTSLHGELVTLLRDMIIDGELRPGEKIPEQTLCARFGVSRTPLREALKVLAAEGLLQLSQNRGASVARISRDEIDELFPIMGALEALAGEMACRRIDDAGIARIAALHRAMLGAYGRGEAGAYAKLNRAIHEALFEAAGNATLTGLYQNLMVRIHSIRFFARKSPARWREAVDDHEAMMVALEARDGPALAHILTLHLRHKAEMVAESLEEADGAAAG
jgi:DNA-binding GntR family transcriptional regulator